MPMLPDGTVLPHYFDVDAADRGGFGGNLFSDTTLHVGEVVRSYPPGTPDNQYEDETEYVVMVEHRDGNGTIVSSPYRCTLASSLGAIGDSFRYSLRVSSGSNTNSNQPQTAVTDGATVVIACLNGDPNTSIILGAIRHPQAPKDQVGAGRYLDFVFNGVETHIEDDGSLTVEVLGPTQNDGTIDPNTQNADQKGCYVNFGADGSIVISNNRTPSLDESITISTKDKKITVAAGEHATETETDWTVSVGANGNISATDNLVLSANKDAQLAGDNIFVGSTSSQENLVLGQKLVSALNDFIDIFMQNATYFSFPDLLGAPVPINPAVLAQMKAWQARYTTNAGTASPAGILASDKFTER